MAVKNAVLLSLRQAGKQGQHLGGARPCVVRQVLAQVVGGFADFALAGQENQNVAPCPAQPEFVHAIGNGAVQVVVARFFKRAPALFDRKSTARDHDDGRGPVSRCKVPGKAVSVNGGRGHNDFQVRSARQYLAQVAEQKVDVQAAFVCLVDDDGVVGQQQRVILRFGQQDAVGHELDGRVFAQAVLKPYFEAHHLAQRGFEFFGYAFGHRTGGNAARLGVANQAAPLARFGVDLAASQHQGDLGQLRGFTRSGLAAHDDDLVLLDGGHDFVTTGRDRQAFGEVDLERDRVC